MRSEIRYQICIESETQKHKRSQFPNPQITKYINFRNRNHQKYQFQKHDQKGLPNFRGASLRAAARLSEPRRVSQSRGAALAEMGSVSESHSESVSEIDSVSESIPEIVSETTSVRFGFCFGDISRFGVHSAAQAVHVRLYRRCSVSFDRVQEASAGLLRSSGAGPRVVSWGSATGKPTHGPSLSHPLQS